VLTLTENAAEAVRNIVPPLRKQEARAPGFASSRSRCRTAPTVELGVAVVEAPADSDEVIEEEGARVFLDSATTDYLEAKVLDASGSDEGVRFTIAEQ
jgi:Fe-S cluster assembly iron-binding protein IscA